MAIQSLSTIRPDPQDLMVQLQSILLTKDSWKGILATETGQTFLEMIASIGGFDQYAIERVFKEMFPQTARLDSSIFGSTRLLGVRLKRKTPASVEVSFENTGGTQYSISRFTQFSLGDYLLFNEDAIVIPASSTVTVFLREGRKVTNNYTSTGTNFQTVISPEPDFAVSDIHILVEVNSVEIPRKTEGLWRFRGQDAYQDTTTRNGNLMIIFGDTLRGTRPNNGANISLTYFVTQGLLGNDASVLNEEVTFTGQPTTIIAEAIGPLSGGTNEIPARLYRDLSPRFFAAQNSAIRSPDFDLIFEYPDLQITDYKVLGQKDLDTSDPEYMNLVKVWLLYSGASITDNQFRDFENWLRRRAIWTLRYFYDEGFAPAVGIARPIPMDFNIDAEIYCQNYAQLSDIKTQVENDLTKFMSLDKGTISRDVYRSDIINVIKRTNSAIDYVVLNSPTMDVITNYKSLLPTGQSFNTGGTLGNALNPMIYFYFVTALYSGGNYPAGNFETKPDALINVAVPAGVTTGKVVLEWKPLFGVTGYNVYGRLIDGTFGRIATNLPASTTTFTDTGAITPDIGLQPPTQDLSGMRYPSLNVLDIKTDFSKRSFT